MADTKIEWCDRVWNPVTGCSKVSAGCKYCYAEALAHRFWKDRAFTQVMTHPERLQQVYRWRKPSRIFVNSMSDLFHEAVPDQFIYDVFKAMFWGNRRHTFLVLTKRPERMLAWMVGNQEKFWHYHAPEEPPRPYVGAPWPDPCLWMGVSVEDQRTADSRIPPLLFVEAGVRFVSVEPMLGAVDLTRFLAGGKIGWVICGCESGPHARPMDYVWAQSLRDQCLAAEVPFFLKQMMGPTGKITKKPFLDGRQWLSLGPERGDY